MARYGTNRKRNRYSVNSTFLEVYGRWCLPAGPNFRGWRVGLAAISLALSPSLQDQLLSDEERALYELDQSFIQDVTRAQEEQETAGRAARLLSSCVRSCARRFCADKGLVSLMAMLCVTVAGVGILVLARWRDAGVSVDLFGQYVVSAGVFGLASGGTNWLAVVGLFYKVPGFIGSGVFYRRHEQIRHVMKLIVLQMVFDSQHLQTYLSRKIAQFSSSIQVVDSINSALSSPEVERIVEERLEILFVQPEGQFLEALGLSRERLRPLVKPAVLSLYAEAAPLVLDGVTERRGDQGISVPQFREEMDRYLSWRAEAVTEKDIGKLMRRHLFRHLSWIVVWGSVFGLLTGLVVQALHISLNFDIIRPY